MATEQAFNQSELEATIARFGVDATQRFRFADGAWINLSGYQSFEDAVRESNNRGMALCIDQAVTQFNASVTINQHVFFVGPGSITVPSGKTLTINGPLEAPIRKIFDTSSGGVVNIGLQAVDVYPQWWGAKADGVTDDRQAVETAALAVAVGGTLKCPSGTYHSSLGFTIRRSDLFIVGGGMPKVSDDLTHLIGGTIFRGQFLLDGDNLTAHSFGVDFGITYSNASRGGLGGNAFVAHPDPNGASPNWNFNNHFKDIIGLIRMGDASDLQAAFHAILIDTVQYGTIDNLVGIGGWFGIVMEVMDFNVGSIMGRENASASVYLKSRVTDGGLVRRVNIKNVIASNNVAAGYVGFIVQASDGTVEAVTVGNVSVTGGQNAVRIESEGAQPVIGVAIDCISTSQTNTGVSILGAVYATVIGRIVADRPASGQGFQIGPNTVAISPNDVTVADLRVNVNVGQASANVVDISDLTRVILDNVHATSSYNTPAKIRAGALTSIGQYFGTLSLNLTQANLKNGWAVVGGGIAGTVTQNGFTKGYGRLLATSATSDVFMTLPDGAHPFNTDFFTTMTAFDGGTSKHVPVAVHIASNGDVSVYPNRASYAALAFFNLTDFMISAQLPVQGAF